MSKEIRITDHLAMEIPNSMSRETMEKIRQRIIKDVREALIATGQIEEETDDD